VKHAGDEPKSFYYDFSYRHSHLQANVFEAGFRAGESGSVRDLGALAAGLGRFIRFSFGSGLNPMTHLRFLSEVYSNGYRKTIEAGVKGAIDGLADSTLTRNGMPR